jgi:AcrR family transcriptional regulator
MIILARHIRGVVAHLEGANRPPTPAQQDRQAYILEAGRIAIGQFGFGSITMAKFSLGLRLTPAQIRWHYPDLENLLGAIFRDHLTTIANAIDNAGHGRDDKQRRQAARAAYFGATRDATGAFNDTHRLFLRDRSHLPEDEAKSVDLHVGRLARALGGDTCGMQALELLNREDLSLAGIEDALAERTSAAPDPGPVPAIMKPPPAIIRAAPAEPPCVPHQLPRHMRRKIEALRRKRQRQDGK